MKINIPIEDLQVNANNIVDSINCIKKSGDAKEISTKLNHIAAAADELMTLADETILQFK